MEDQLLLKRFLAVTNAGTCRFSAKVIAVDETRCGCQFSPTCPSLRVAHEAGLWPFGVVTRSPKTGRKH